MFIGHLALGFAAKKLTPRVSLAMLLLASQWADILWPVLVALGIEEVRIDPGNTAVTPLDFVSYPYSHSLLLLIVWGVVIGGAYRGIAGGRRTFQVLGALVVSHWLLDCISHRPDMPLYPHGGKYGLGLWNSMPATLAIEATLYVLGVWVYLRWTKARDRIGHWGLLSMVVLLAVVYVANVFGPPPPSVPGIYVSAIIGASVLTLWAWWADRHRDSIP